MNETTLTLVGNLTAEPELRVTPTGRAVANFNVATTPRRRDGENWVDGTTTFWTCELWGQPAEHAAAALHRGQRVITTGVARTDVWTDSDGTERRALRVVIDEIGPSLKFGHKPTQLTAATTPTPDEPAL
jgi:single-strand DNA-binding protein